MLALSLCTVKTRFGLGPYGDCNVQSEACLGHERPPFLPPQKVVFAPEGVTRPAPGTKNVVLPTAPRHGDGLAARRELVLLATLELAHDQGRYRFLRIELRTLWYAAGGQ